MIRSGPAMALTTARTLAVTTAIATDRDAEQGRNDTATPTFASDGQGIPLWAHATVTRAKRSNRTLLASGNAYGDNANPGGRLTTSPRRRASSAAQTTR